MLRLLVLALLLANLAVLAWQQGWLGPELRSPAQAEREPERLARQVHPEQVRVLSPRSASAALAGASAAASSAGVAAGAAAEAAASAVADKAASSAPAGSGAAAASNASPGAASTPASAVKSGSRRAE